ncbi:MAG: peptidylprolyl isomerase [Negativicutes bacterium]|nr:peptidylprolyl isomerase [Negativicutes bacterium]
MAGLKLLGRGGRRVLVVVAAAIWLAAPAVVRGQPEVLTADGIPDGFRGPLRATIETTAGEWVFDLFPDRAPVTVANFVRLANRHYYDGMIIYRIGRQPPAAYSGDPLNSGQGDCGYTIADEFDNGLTNEWGTLAADNSGPDTSGGRWLINLADNFGRDGRFTVFGQYDGDRRLLEDLLTLPVDDWQRPLTPIIVKAVVIWRP